MSADGAPEATLEWQALANLVVKSRKAYELHNDILDGVLHRSINTLLDGMERTCTL